MGSFMMRTFLLAAVLALVSQGAHAFTIVNQENYSQGGARMMQLNLDAQYNTKKLRDGTGWNSGNSSAGGQGYGGLETYNITRPYGTYDHMPQFPGSNNHLSPGANAGMLQYGATPGRSW